MAWEEGEPGDDRSPAVRCYSNAARFRAYGCLEVRKLLRIDTAAIKRETHLDGKWLLRCSDRSLSSRSNAAGGT